MGKLGVVSEIDCLDRWECENSREIIRTKTGNDFKDSSIVTKTSWVRIMYI
jgi:hypothetical protein